MKEIQEILKKAAAFANDEKAILATVVDVVGSGYRRPGARMLIDENGYSIGTVSGGCLEADVLERAKKVLQTGKPAVITYDTTQDENSVFGLSMGCRGIVRILLEAVSPNSEIIEYLANLSRERMSGVIATQISAEDHGKIGRRLFFNENEIHSTDFSESETIEILPTMRQFLTNHRTEVQDFNFGEIFIEIVTPPLRLLLFGAGYDALPLVKFAAEIGWSVTAIDHRPAFANPQRLLEASEIIVSASEDLPESLFTDENSVAVIMTHNYERDRNILRRLLNSECRYIGALGPKKRTEKLLEEIGEGFSRPQLARLHAPVGLDIGAQTPETIALSIVAEIQSVTTNRAGGFLRNRLGSIYDHRD